MTTTHLTEDELRRGAINARITGLSMDHAAEAALIDCREGLAVALVGTHWYLVDLDTEENGYFEVVADGYMDGARAVAA